MDEKAIELLCEKFHTTTDYLIPTYQHYIIGKDIASIIICIIMIILILCLMRFCYKKGKQRCGNNYDVTDWSLGEMFAYIGGGVVTIFALVILFGSIYDCVLWIASPEMRFLDTVIATK